MNVLRREARRGYSGLNLPRVPGVDILRQIRSDPRLTDTHVVVTAHDELTNSLQGQADLVLIKPVAFSGRTSLNRGTS